MSIAPQVKIADRFGDPGEFFHRCTYNHFTPCFAARRQIHIGPVKGLHQFAIELSSHIRARSGITCLTEFFVESLRYQAYFA
jgi:hypothetical protein